MVKTALSVEPVKALGGMTFGVDPELFVVNDKGVLVSAEGLLPGTKEEPYKVDKGAVQVDGMAAEFNTDPVDNYFDWETNISSVLSTLKGMLPKGYKLLAKPAVVFGEKEWEEAPDCAKVLGCSPDFNAWTGEVNSPPCNSEENPRLRTASGHIHIGWTDEAPMEDIQHLTACQDLVKQLDYYLGAWSLLKDRDARRRELYGKAGAMRYKPYGVEYRVLSNFWVTDKQLRLEVWNRLQRGILDMKTKFIPGATSKAFNRELVMSIDNSTLSEAIALSFAYPVKTLEPQKRRVSPSLRSSAQLLQNTQWLNEVNNVPETVEHPVIDFD